MPTVRWEPRKSSFRHHFRSLERFDLAELLSDLDLIMLVQLVVQKKRSKQGRMTAHKRKAFNVILATIMIATMSIEDDIARKRDTIFYPPVETPTYGIESTYWQNHPALFFSRFRFRQPDLLRVLHAMGLYGKRIMVGKKGHYAY
jgi:hypothetical protein